jgi:hypothetical protein
MALLSKSVIDFAHKATVTFLIGTTGYLAYELGRFKWYRDQDLMNAAQVTNLLTNPWPLPLNFTPLLFDRSTTRSRPKQAEAWL